MNKRGQSALELAIFGSIFLFCLGALVSYGISYNFTQNHQMRAFRQALNSANNTTVAGTTKYYSVVNLTDKHIPDTQDPWAIGRFQPFVVDNSVTVSNELDYEPAWRYTKHLPEINFKINQKTLPLPYKTAGYKRYYLTDVLTAGTPPPAEDDKGDAHSDYPSTGYKILKSNIISRKVADLLDNFKLDGSVGKDDIYWRWLTIDLSKPEDRLIKDGILCDEDGKPKKADIDGNGTTDDDEVLLAEGMSIDLNGDGSEELIINFITREISGGGGGGIGGIIVDASLELKSLAGFRCMDFTLGEMDMTLNKDETPINERAGLVPGYTKIINDSRELTIITSEEDKAHGKKAVYKSIDNLGNEDSPGYSETFRRTIKKREDEYEDIANTTTTSKRFGTTTWETEY